MIAHAIGMTEARSMRNQGRYPHGRDFRPASSDEPVALLRAYRRTGDRAARERVVELYLPLVRALARRYGHCGERFDDLVQVGSIGLIEAIDRFDPERGSDLPSFAIPTITGAIRHHLRDRSAVVRLPRRHTELLRRLRDPRSRLTARLERSPSVSELAREAGVDERDVALAIETEQHGHPLSLSAADQCEPEANASDDAFDLSHDRLLLAPAFRSLSVRERRIVHLRFFAGLSQAEIAREVGLSQVQVSRLLRASLERMRRAIEQRSLPPRADEGVTGLVQRDFGL
jgi:RNA polymerase sigma-B factor